MSLINSSDPTSASISIDRSSADFIKDMFFGSKSAIDILNDLLQYERVEAGMYVCVYVGMYVCMYVCD